MANYSLDDYLATLSGDQLSQAASKISVGLGDGTVGFNPAGLSDQSEDGVRKGMSVWWSKYGGHSNIRDTIASLGGTSYLNQVDTQERMGVAHDAARTEMLQDAISMPGRKSTILTGNGLDPQRPAPLPQSTILTSPLTLNNPLNPRRI